MAQKQEGSLVIGVSGITCSGKTTLASSLFSLLKSSHSSSPLFLLSQDDFYKEPPLPIISLSPRGRGEGERGDNIEFTNWDSPLSLNFEALFEALSQKQKISGSVVIVEGFQIYQREEDWKHFDFLFFVEIDPQIAQKRRFERDQWIQKNPHYFEVVLTEYKSYLQLITERRRREIFQASSFWVLDGTKSVEKLTNEIFVIINKSKTNTKQKEKI